MKHFKRLLVFGSILLLPGLINSQFRQPQLTRIDKSKGIESNAPVDIKIDKDYKYWIASYHGLIEYDGNRFKTYHMPFSQGELMGSDLLFDIAFANDSILWVTHTYGIAKFNIHSKVFELLPIQDVANGTPLTFRAVFIDKNNDTYFCSMQTKALKYDAESNSVVVHKPMDVEDHDYVLNIEELSSKYYVLQTRNGLELFDRNKNKVADPKSYPEEYKWMQRPELKGYVNDFETIGDYNFVSVFNWSINQYNVFRHDSRTGELIAIPIISRKGRMFYKDSFNRLWLYGFRDQVEVYDCKSNRVFALPDKSINTDDIDFSVCYRVFEDHEHNIWFCTNNGLFTFNQFQNNYEVISNELPKNIYSRMDESEPGVIWFGTVDNGIFEYRSETGEFRNYPGSGGTRFGEIKQIRFNNDGRHCWIIQMGGLLTRYTKSTNSFEFYNDSLFRNNEVCIAETRNGELYFVTLTGDIAVYDEAKNSFRKLFNFNEIHDFKRTLEINAAEAAGDESLLLGTTELGLIKLNMRTKKFENFKLDINDPSSLRSNLVIALGELDPAYVFGSTLNGVFRFDIVNNRVENFNFRNNFSLGMVFDFTVLKNNRVITVGTNGMHLLDWNTRNIIDLGQKSNIDKLQLSGVIYSAKADRVFISSEEALYKLELNPQNYNPRLKPIIYSLSSFDKLFNIGDKKEIVLDKNHNSFEISFGTSTYKYKEDLEYYYKLYDEEWIPASSREVAFSKLPGGSYTFRLKVVYKGNREIVSETALKIIIQKAFYETIWFYMLVAITTAVLIYVVYRIRVNRLLAIEKVRFQLSRDLHDDMGSTLSTINILSSIAADKLDKDPASTRGYISRIASNSQQMMESMDDIVWSINPANDDMKRVIYRMREFASGILEPKQIALIFYSSEETNALKLSMAHRRDFFLLFKEAVNNAAKYSECKRVKVSLCIEKKQLVLSIKDDGKGFVIREYEDGNGLTNMRKRAALLDADFKIESVIGQGTSIEAKMNLNKL